MRLAEQLCRRPLDRRGTSSPRTSRNWPGACALQLPRNHYAIQPSYSDQPTLPRLVCFLETSSIYFTPKRSRSLQLKISKIPLANTSTFPLVTSNRGSSITAEGKQHPNRANNKPNRSSIFGYPSTHFRKCKVESTCHSRQKAIATSTQLL